MNAKEKIKLFKNAINDNRGGNVGFPNSNSGNQSALRNINSGRRPSIPMNSGFRLPPLPVPRRKKKMEKEDPEVTRQRILDKFRINEHLNEEMDLDKDEIRIRKRKRKDDDEENNNSGGGLFEGLLGRGNVVAPILNTDPFFNESAEVVNKPGTKRVRKKRKIATKHHHPKNRSFPANPMVINPQRPSQLTVPIPQSNIFKKPFVGRPGPSISLFGSVEKREPMSRIPDPDSEPPDVYPYRIEPVKLEGELSVFEFVNSGRKTHIQKLRRKILKDMRLVDGKTLGDVENEKNRINIDYTCGKVVEQCFKLDEQATHLEKMMEKSNVLMEVAMGNFRNILEEMGVDVDNVIPKVAEYTTRVPKVERIVVPDEPPREDTFFREENEIRPPLSLEY